MIVANPFYIYVDSGIITLLLQGDVSGLQGMEHCTTSPILIPAQPDR